MARFRKTKSGRAQGKWKTPSVYFEYSTLFRKDANNVIFQVTADQMPVLKRISLDDMFLTKGNIREPHWHPNAAELDYVVSGEAIIAVLDPIRHQLLRYHVTPGQVVFIPMNWWHWQTPLSDDVHIVEIFSHERRQIIEGSDTLRRTPPEVFQMAYGVDAKQFAALLSSIQKTVVIGPVVGTSDPQRTMPISKDFAPGTPNLFFDLKRNLAVRNDGSFLYEVTSKQIPLMNMLSLGDLYLTKDHIREPHWHPNADEFDYIVSGEVTVSIVNPFTLELLTSHLKPGQVIFIPQGWFHWIIPVTEEAHLLVNFNDGMIESIEGSDVLRLTPPDVFQQAYGINAAEFTQEIRPINRTLTIGPPNAKSK